LATRHRAQVICTLAFLVALIVGCGDDDDSAESEDLQPVSEITITAVGIAFDIDEFTVSSGEEITITFDNQHDGVPHNISFADIQDAATELTDGPDTQQLTFTAPAPGEYEFQCDAHPPQMSGTMVVR
jgi:plastocyanin